jgi:hypothetical protein
MIGKWIGTYSYSSQVMRKLIPNAEVSFEINIDKFDVNNFNGTVKDDPSTGGTPGIGVITGKIIGNKIEFIKKMPIRSSYLTTGDYLVESGKKHTPIYYSGVLGLNKKEAKGEWRIKMGLMLVGFLPILRLPTRGEWSMIFQGKS